MASDIGGQGTCRAGRPEAAALIWQWRSREDRASLQRERSASARRARVRGAIQALIGAGVGTLAYFYDATALAGFIYAVAGLILIASQLSPTALFGGIEQLFRTLGLWLGRALTWLLLVPLFYLFFLPFGMVMRSGRRDRLRCYFEPETESYWEDLEGPTASSRSLERQY